MGMGWPEDDSHLYKDYYDAVNSGDEWAGVRAEEISKQIKSKKEADSYQGGS